jgi:beta propeller repeat protein
MKVAGIGILALATPVLALAQSSVTVTGTSVQITTNPAGQINPAISGNIVAYTDLRNGNMDVYYTDISTGVETQVTNATGVQEDELADVSGNTIVYVEYLAAGSSDVLGYTIGGGPLSSPIAAVAKSQETNPSVGGTVVAWETNQNGSFDIYAKDLSTGTVKQITSNGGVNNSHTPNVSGRLIAYSTQTSTSCQIFVTNFDTLTTTQLTNTAGCNQSTDISGNLVTYAANRTGASGTTHVYVYDLTTDTETQATTTGSQQNPHISGNWVAYEDVETSSSGSFSSIMLYYVPTGSVFTAVAGTSPADSAFLNDIDGMNVAYTGNASGSDHIYVYEFTATVSNPDPTDCNHLNGASPLFSATYTRQSGQSDDYYASFSAQPGLGLVCVSGSQCPDANVEVNWSFLFIDTDNGNGNGNGWGGWGGHGHGGSSSAQATTRLWPKDNWVHADLDSPDGCAVTVDVYAMGSPDGGTGDGDCDDDGDGDHHHGDHGWGGGGDHCHPHPHYDMALSGGSSAGGSHDVSATTSVSLTASLANSSSAYPGAAGWDGRVTRPETGLGCSTAGQGLDAALLLTLLAAVAMLPKRAMVKARSRRL